MSTVTATRRIDPEHFEWTGLTEGKEYKVVGISEDYVTIQINDRSQAVHRMWFGFGTRRSLKTFARQVG